MSSQALSLHVGEVFFTKLLKSGPTRCAGQPLNQYEPVYTSKKPNGTIRFHLKLANDASRRRSGTGPSSDRYELEIPTEMDQNLKSCFSLGQHSQL